MATSTATLKRGYGEVDSGATLVYESKDFIYDPTGAKERRKRPTKVYGEIAIRDGARESDDLSPLACRRANGSFEETPAPFAAGGHLVASILSGSNDPQNIVPVSTEFNTKMKQVEKDIQTIIQGEDVVNPHLTVEVTEYWDVDPRIPKSVKYTLSYEERQETDKTEAISTRHPRKAQKTEQKVYVFVDKKMQFGPIVQNYLVVRAEKQHLNLRKWLQQLQDEMASKNWKIEDLPSYQRHISNNLTQVAWNKRPYAVLDYWFLVKDGKGYKDDNYKPMAANYKQSIGIGCEFYQEQKDLIRRVCYAFNNGFLKSDAHGRKGDPGVPIIEPHLNLIHGAAGNGPSFDHICPVALDGSNLFSNCQVTSGAFNSRKGKQF
jgi:hypothetical protein